MTKFPKCSEYALTSYYNKEKKLIIEDYAEVIEQALTQAESKGIQLGKDIGIRVGFTQGAKAERERIYALLAKLRNDRFVYNDEMKLAVDMIKDEITS